MLTRRNILVALLALLVAGANVAVWFGIVAWREDVSEQRAEAESLGLEIADIRADAQALEEAQAILSEQIDDGSVRIEELTSESKPVLLQADRVMDIAARLDACAIDRRALIASLWVQSASSLASQEAETNARCTAALNDLEELLPGGVMP